MIVKRVGPLSLAKVTALIYALIALFFGACVSLVAMAGMLSDTNEFGPFAGLLGIGAVVFLPIFYGVMTFIVALIMAFLYNLIASVTGGVEIDVS